MPIDWRQREKAARFDHGAPIRYISLAPVAGVMLVAAAMVSLSYRSPTYALTFDLPSGGNAWPYNEWGPNPQSMHSLIVTSEGQYELDSKRVTPDDLRLALTQLMRVPLSPAIVFAPYDDAPYGASFGALSILQSSGAAAAGICFQGLEHNRHFERPSAHRTVIAPNECYPWPWQPLE